MGRREDLQGRKIGVIAELIADVHRRDEEKGRRRRVRQEGHRRRNRDISAQSHADEGSADDLEARNHEENADEQADRHTARDGPASEAPQIGFADSLAEGL